MKRTARLVLVTRDAALVGTLPPIDVETPWWQDVAPVVRAARERFGIDVVVLRLLAAELAQPPGGAVTYLAEVDAAVAADVASTVPWDGTLTDEPLRQSYARPGGPAADLAWVLSVLDHHGLRTTAAPEQIRTWNLSSVWRLPVDRGDVWLKVVPPFMAHEGALLKHLAGAPVPRVLGHDGGRTLLAHVPGSDLYDAGLPQLLDMVTLLVDLQARSASNLDALFALGLPDWRRAALTDAIVSVIGRTSHELADDDVEVLSTFAADLPRRFDALAACGLPDTLVHGDFHPGNFRGDDADITLLDWGDSGVGHPLLDQSAFLDRIAKHNVAIVRAHWLNTWRGRLLGADPERAAQLLAPVAAARQAVIYRRFLDHIEPAEHPYHRADPADWLRRTAAVLRDA